MNPNLLHTKNLPYFLENILKVAFIVLAIIRHEYTLMVGLIASILGLVRMLKMPQLNK
jgi:hypothetical protein